MKKYLINFAQEGKIIILSMMFMSILFYLLYYNFEKIFFLNGFYIVTFLFIVTCFFFRDPIRVINMKDSNEFLSPADGKIVSIKHISDPDIGESIKIAIFLSFFNVHRQWVPVNSKVLKINYNPGKYFVASKDKASLDNEQSSILFNDSNSNSFRIKQIAGFVARRIVNHMESNMSVKKGDKLGFIKFGSRVEIIVPNNFKLNVKKGQHVKGCKTIIGQFKS